MTTRASGPLIVRLSNWVGEVVLSLPALRRLEGAGYELQLVGPGWSPALLEGTDWPVTARARGLWPATRQLRALDATLRRAAAPRTPALLFTKSLSSALEARLAGLAPAGYARDGRSPLLAAAYPLPPLAHAGHAYWHLVSRLLGADAPFPTALGLVPSAAQRRRAAALLESHALAAQRYVLLCPFSGADDRERRKVWPGFGELAAWLVARDVAVLVCPGPGEESLAAETLPQARQLTGVDLGLYAALLERAAVVVANDTGPGHLAAAVGARLVSVYGPQSVAAWAPLGARVRLFHDAGGWPSVEQVAAAVLE